MTLNVSAQNSIPMQKANLNKSVPFKGGVQYENPVNKGMEYFNASLGPVAGSTLAGGAAALLTGSKHALNMSKKASVIAGAITGLGVLALTLPSKLYHTSVKVFGKTKEMDVYSRGKSVETSLSEQIDAQSRNPEVPLENSVNNYLKFQMGKQGKGMPIISA